METSFWEKSGNIAVLSFLIFLAVALIFDAQAQTTSRAGFQIKFPDSSRKAFFDQHRNVDSIVVVYRNNRAADLNLIFRENGQESLDLTFEGDRYVLIRSVLDLLNAQ